MNMTSRPLPAWSGIASMALILIGETLLAGPAGEVDVIREATAAGPAANAQAGIQATVDAYRADLGSPNNGNAVGSQGAGRRQITWDGGDNDSAPARMPGDFFNAIAPRGALIFGGDGRAQFQVSADSTPSVPGTLAEFGNVNATYPTAFATFSAPRLFTALNDNVIYVRFHVPGTDLPATVTGFGAVFTDVDQAGSTRIEYFDLAGRRLFVRDILATAGNESLSFLGVRFTEAVVHTVRITCGAASLGPDDLTQGGAQDVVVMDDFIYGEPQPVLEAISHTRHRAPSHSDTFFAAPGFAAVNAEGETLFHQRLSGLGSTRLRNQALFTTAGVPETGLVVQSGILDGIGAALPIDTMATNLFNPIFNQDDQYLFQATLRGTGVTAANRSVVMFDNGHTTHILARTGFPLSGLAGGTMGQIREALHSPFAGITHIPLWYRMTPGGAVTRANDSGVHTLTTTGIATLALAREGQVVFGPSGDAFGEISGSVSVGASNFVNFRSFIRPAAGGPGLDGLFFMQTSPLNNGESGRQGDASPGVAGATFRRFIGTNSAGAVHLFRATIAGPGVNVRNNEGLWAELSGLRVRKGEVLAPTGFTLRRIIKYWAISQDIVFHGIISGPGVNPSNNQALMRWVNATGDVQILLRTGDIAPGAQPATATIGGFQAIDVDPASGFMTVLSPLRGAAPATNQILWRGQGLAFTKVLQKGDFFCSTITPGAEIRGISLRPITDRGGACGRGLGQTIGNQGDIVAALITDLRERELVVLRR